MPDTAEPLKICGSDVGDALSYPDTRLQILDRRVGTKKLFFPKEQFEKSVHAWENIPLIFYRPGEHPTDFVAVKDNPAAAAEAMGGRLVGRVTNPRILLEGHPNLMASLEIDSHKDEISKLYKEGKLSLSTAFTAHSDGDKLTSPPIPNHVLLFEEKADKAIPGDPGAFVHSIEVESKMTNEEMDESKFNSWFRKAIMNLFKQESSDTVKNASPEDTMPENAPTETAAEAKLEAIERAIAEKDAEIAQLKGKIDELTAKAQEVDTLKEKLSKYEQAETEHKFSQFLQSVVPEGMKATEDMRKEIRKKYDEDPISLMLSIAAENKVTNSGVTQKTGEPFMNTEDAKEQKTPTTTVGDMSAVGGGK